MKRRCIDHGPLTPALSPSLARRRRGRRSWRIGEVLFLALSIGLGHVGQAAVSTQGNQEIRLLARADDMGSFHAANLACIAAGTKGIARSVELMVPGPWFAEAVKLLRDNPQLDVGIHLTLTSEWETCRWSPMSSVPSLVDADRRFFPMVWRNPNFRPKSSLQESSWNLAEIEKELRVQIEIALRNVPRITHMGSHMGFEGLDPRIGQLVERLRTEYKLQPGSAERALKFFPGWGKERSVEGRISAFVANVEKMTPGTYLFIEHPAVRSPEMETVGHRGYEDVAADREAVLKVYTSSEVVEAIRKKGVKLISYADLIEK